MSAPTSQTAGSVLLAEDGVVGTSGAPTRIFSIHMISGAGGAGVLTLCNGTAATDTIYMEITGTAASTGITDNFGRNGFLFPDGCFADFDDNVATLEVTYSQ